MSVGDHLDELRSRLIKALVGLFAAFALCLTMVKGYVLPVFCRPLILALLEAEVTPQMYFTSVSDPFVVYIKISLIAGAVIASPWIVWQVWQFVAAGLYAHERRTVTRYIPLSLALLGAGLAFVYFFVLPMTLKFFLAWSLTIPLPEPAAKGPPPIPPGATIATPESAERFAFPLVAGNPVEPVPGQVWFDTTQQRLEIFLDGQTRVLAFTPQNLTAPIITLPEYVNLVLLMLLTFGLSFQLPLVVMAVLKADIVDAETLRGQRKLVYFGIVVLACLITPGDVIVATLALVVPLAALFELGIWLGTRGKEPRGRGFEVTQK